MSRMHLSELKGADLCFQDLADVSDTHSLYVIDLLIQPVRPHIKRHGSRKQCRFTRSDIGRFRVEVQEFYSEVHNHHCMERRRVSLQRLATKGIPVVQVEAQIGK